MSTYFKVRIVRLHRKLTNRLTQYDLIDGTKNVWIVKPSYNARGIGIYCTNKFSQITSSVGQKVKSQQKVVQKYIEKPLCVGGKKFDFRQWVLVNSWEPLDVSIFSSAYLKMCGSTFDLTQLNDTFRHLSNFSLQKKGDQDSADLVMSTAQFQEYIRSQGD